MVTDGQPGGADVLVGIDAGTSSVKALLMTPEGRDLAVGRAPTPWTTVTTGAETDPAALLDAARAALADALGQRPGVRVLGIAVASMGESGVLVDASDRPLAPVIAWHDDRDRGELDELVRDLGSQAFSRHTGLPVWPQWSVTKHRWLRVHTPATEGAVHRYNVAEWLVRGLGGDPVSELSLASRTGWLDIHTARPWAEAMAWSGAAPTLLGDLVPAGTPCGRARGDGDLAAIDGAVLTVAGHDHQVAAVGLGLHMPGDEFDSCGTAEALCRTATPGLPDDTVVSLTEAGVTVGWHAARDRWCFMGATQGGLALGRVMEALGAGRDGLAQLDAAARDAAEVPGAVRLDPATAEVEIDPRATPGEVWRAATRAVTAEARTLSERLGDASGPRRELVVAGGWAHSEALLAAKSAAFGDFRRADASEAGCRGAAFLAGLAAGTYAGFEDFPAHPGPPGPPAPSA